MKTTKPPLLLAAVVCLPLVALVALVVPVAPSADAQPLNPTPTTPTMAAAATAEPLGLPGAETVPPAGRSMLGASRVRAVAGNGETAGVELGDRLVLEVDGLDALLASTEEGCSELVLFLDGIGLAGTPVVSCQPEIGQVEFVLARSDSSTRAWHSILGSPTGLRRKVAASVGAKLHRPIPSDVEELELIVVPLPEFFIFLALLTTALLAFLVLARRTNLVRNPNAPPRPDGAQPYSLARCQLAFWFFLVIAAYVFIWLVTEELSSLTQSILGLVGISSGTALGAALVDSDPASRAASAAAKAAPRQAQRQGGFFADILSDRAGLSFHRFQMLVWTVVLGLIFVASVYNTLAMPEFSAGLIGLMGISSGTYLGFKFPERSTPAVASPTQDEPPPATPPAGE